jgi:hypothetical protein
VVFSMRSGLILKCYLDELRLHRINVTRSKCNGTLFSQIKVQSFSGPDSRKALLAA